MEPRTTEVRRTLTDAWGASHEYLYHLHPGRSGSTLFFRVAKIVSGALARIAGSVKAESVMDSEISLEEMGAAMREVAGGILEHGGDELLSAILTYVVRDKEKLSDPAAFDRAYQGNYGELLSIVGHVLWDNFGKGFTAANSPFSGLLKVRTPLAAKSPE